MSEYPKSNIIPNLVKDDGPIPNFNVTPEESLFGYLNTFTSIEEEPQKGESYEEYTKRMINSYPMDWQKESLKYLSIANPLLSVEFSQYSISDQQKNELICSKNLLDYSLDKLGTKMLSIENENIEKNIFVKSAKFVNSVLSGNKNFEFTPGEKFFQLRRSVIDGQKSILGFFHEQLLSGSEIRNNKEYFIFVLSSLEEFVFNMGCSQKVVDNMKKLFNNKPKHELENNGV